MRRGSGLWGNRRKTFAGERAPDDSDILPAFFSFISFCVWLLSRHDQSSANERTGQLVNLFLWTPEVGFLLKYISKIDR